MNLIEKLKETILSVFPVMAIVLILGIFVVPLGFSLILRFIIGGFLLIIGLTALLMGVDIGIQPIGEQTGAALTSKKNLPLLLGVAFFIGFLVTIAEPDIQVFGDQIHSVFNSADKTIVILMIALGVGIFITLGLLKTILRINLKLLLFICYGILFALTYFSPQAFKGIAFDSGGATTGPLTVPFILALGVGVSSVRSSKDSDNTNESFGLTGVTSIGPIFAVLIYSIILSKFQVFEPSVHNAQNLSQENLSIFIHILPEVILEAFCSILPLIIMFIVFQVTLLHLPPHGFFRMAAGLVWSFLGLTIFLTGVNGGFMETGLELGRLLGQKASESAGIWPFFLILTGLIFGAVVVCAEPAVWVLTEQVENLTGGTIKRKFMLVFLSIGAAGAIALTMWRAIAGVNLMKILLPGYAIALLLMIWSPNLFTAIAFDSGGVASGPITSTFVLSFTLGASNACGSSTDSFGVIALVAMTPLIAIQILGIIYNFKKNKKSKINMEVKN